MLTEDLEPVIEPGDHHDEQPAIIVVDIGASSEYH